jgi:hypothetical protein
MARIVARLAVLLPCAGKGGALAVLRSVSQAMREAAALVTRFRPSRFAR